MSRPPSPATDVCLPANPPAELRQRPTPRGRRAELREIDGAPLHSEIHNVFAVADGTITRIDDHAERDAAPAGADLASD
jgi:hypothetical protein